MAFSFFRIFAASLLFLPVFFGMNASQAAERVMFSDLSEKLKTTFAGKTSGYSVAKADLNEDGFDEYIFKTPTEDGLFNFEVFALPDVKPVSLALFKGKNVMLGNDYKHGVRNLLVFEDAKNDFSYDIHIWNSQDSRYIPQNTQHNARGEISHP